jgi:choline dehydrogenase-like flavoprotein
MHDFDAIIIGTGQAGPSLAFRLAGAGMKVAGRAPSRRRHLRQYRLHLDQGLDSERLCRPDRAARCRVWCGDRR